MQDLHSINPIAAKRRYHPPLNPLNLMNPLNPHAAGVSKGDTTTLSRQRRLLPPASVSRQKEGPFMCRLKAYFG